MRSRGSILRLQRRRRKASVRRGFMWKRQPKSEAYSQPSPSSSSCLCCQTGPHGRSAPVAGVGWLGPTTPKSPPWVRAGPQPGRWVMSMCVCGVVLSSVGSGLCPPKPRAQPPPDAACWGVPKAVPCPGPCKELRVLLQVKPTHRRSSLGWGLPEQSKDGAISCPALAAPPPP